MIITIKSSPELNLLPFGLDEIWIDVDATGRPVREIGFLGGEIVHKFPGEGEYGRYGVFDVNRFALDDHLPGGDIQEFEQRWSNPKLPSQLS